MRHEGLGTTERCHHRLQKYPRLAAYRQQVAQQKKWQSRDQTSLGQTHSRASVTETLASC
jgi:hypothetical protein